MPRKDQPARDVCRGCQRGMRADRLEGGACFNCRLAAALAGLTAAEARRVRQRLELDYWRREMERRAEAERRRMASGGQPDFKFWCPRCRRQRRASWPRRQLVCIRCEVQLALESAGA